MEIFDINIYIYTYIYKIYKKNIYIGPHYWVDDHPLTQGTDASWKNPAHVLHETGGIFKPTLIPYGCFQK